MKKIVALLICALLIAAFAIPAFAADASPSITISADKSTAAKGETITFTIVASNLTEVKTIAVVPKFDASMFKLVAGTGDSTVFTYMTTPPNNFYFPMVSFDPVRGFFGLFNVASKLVDTSCAIGTFTLEVISECGSDDVTAEAKMNSGTVISVNQVSVSVDGEHSFGAWEPQDPYMNHVRSCSKCGHQEFAEHMWTLGEVIKEATCSEPGIQASHCDVCGCDSQVTLPNDPSKHSYEAVVTAPTCEEKGYTTYTCALCGDSYVADEVPATGHKMGEWVVVTDSTCTEEGEARRDCSACGHTETKVIEKKDHDYVNAVVTAPTCTEQGYTTYTCKCGDSYKDNYVPATGHDMGDWYVETLATCEATGTDRRNCANCDHFETRTTKALGHDYKSEVTKEATCKDEGVLTYTCQNGCGDTYTESIPKTTTHTAKEGETVVIKEPTCTEKGISSGVCAVCGVNMDEFETAALGHDMGEWYVKTDSTCTAEGEERSDCSRCDHYDSKVIDKKDHTYESVVTEPTCTKNGYTTHTCSVCGNSYETPGDKALGHEYTSEVTTEPGCETKGVRTYTCVRGDHSYTEDIAATGHSTANMEVTKEPTCEEDGVMSGKCSVCGKELSNEKIPAIGHNYELTEEVAPTCTEKGHKTYVCKNDASHTKTEEFDALGHTYGDWISVDGENHKHVCACGHEETVAHKWDTGKVTVEPTHTETGIKTYECKDCHAIREEEVAKTTKHEYTDKAEQIVDEDGKVDTKYHTGICACGEQHKEKHSYDIEGDVIKEPTSTERGEKEMFCACGHKIVVKIKADGTLDSEPGMGDITGQVVMTGIAAFSMIAAAAYVFTRKRIA